MPVTALSREAMASIALTQLLSDPKLAYRFVKSATRRNPNVMMGYTYFGIVADGTPAAIFPRKSVGWKGKSFGKYPDITAPEGVKGAEGVAAGLKKAIDISKGASGTTGVWGKMVGPNVFVVLPRKAIVQATMSPSAEKAGIAKGVMAGGVTGANSFDVLVNLGATPVPTLMRPKTVLGIPRVARRPAVRRRK